MHKFMQSCCSQSMTHSSNGENLHSARQDPRSFCFGGFLASDLCGEEKLLELLTNVGKFVRSFQGAVAYADITSIFSGYARPM